MSKWVKIKFSQCIDLSGCEREEVIEYLREDWEAMSDEEKNDEAFDWSNQFVSFSYEEIK